MSILKQLHESITTIVSLNDPIVIENNCIIAKEEIKKLLFEGLPNETLVIIFNNIILEPIYVRINNLEMNLPPASRYTISERENILEMINQLDIFIQALLSNYAPILNTSTYHKKLVQNELLEQEFERDFLLQPEYDGIISVYELLPNHCQRLLDEAYNKVLIYFDRLNKSIGAKEEAYTFVARSSVTLERVESNIERSRKQLIELESKKKSYYGIIGENEDRVDLDEIYKEKWLQLNFTIDNLLLHKRVLAKLIQHLNRMYAMSSTSTVQADQITVFGDRNHELLVKLYDAMQPFLHSATKLEAFIKVFTISQSYEDDKVAFAKVKLDNYGVLITKMNPFFIDPIADRKNYNQWWSERFSFNGKDKDKDAISTLRSNNREGNRKPDHPTVIKEIIDILSENLQ